jgi:hypothetical protein
MSASCNRKANLRWSNRPLILAFSPVGEKVAEGRLRGRPIRQHMVAVN